MPPYPKPEPKARQPKPLKRTGLKGVRKSPYQHPAWRKLARQVKVRSSGWCEVCKRNPAYGDPHHRVYREGKSGWRRLIVDLDQLVAVCRPCHKAFHPEKSASLEQGRGK